MQRQALERLLNETKLSDKELKALLLCSAPTQIVSNVAHDFGSKHIKLGIVSDFHIGHRNFNYKAFDGAVTCFTREKVDAVYCAGDILEGMSGRDGQIYELSDIGYEAQMNRARELVSQFKQPFYFITGNHDQWFKSKMNMGVDVGKELESGNPNLHHLGDMEARLTIGRSLKVWLTHRGNTAYALSYSGQKIINGLEGGIKPHIIINGHLHKSLFMNYRNVAFCEAGTLQNQTEYMAMKGSPANLGWWVFDIHYSKDGVKELNTRWYPRFN